MGRIELMAELMAQAKAVIDHPRFLADIRAALEDMNTLTLHGIYSRNMLPSIITICFQDFVRGTAKIPPG